MQENHVEFSGMSPILWYPKLQNYNNKVLAPVLNFVKDLFLTEYHSE